MRRPFLLPAHAPDRAACCPNPSRLANRTGAPARGRFLAGLERDDLSLNRFWIPKSGRF